MEFQSYDECVARKNEFIIWNGLGVNEREVFCGMSVFKYGSGGFLFRWFVDGRLHRLDGPAYIKRGYTVWYCFGGYVNVRSQAEFEEWLVNSS